MKVLRTSRSTVLPEKHAAGQHTHLHCDQPIDTFHASLVRAHCTLAATYGTRWGEQLRSLSPSHREELWFRMPPDTVGEFQRPFGQASRAAASRA